MASSTHPRQPQNGGSLSSEDIQREVSALVARVRTDNADKELAQAVADLFNRGISKADAYAWTKSFCHLLYQREEREVVSSDIGVGLVEAMYRSAEYPSSAPASESAKEQKDTKASRADLLYAIARRDLLLYRDSAGTCWAGIPQKNGSYHHVELSSKSGAVTSFLHSHYRREHGTVVGADVVRNVLATIEGDLAEESETRDNYVRLAWNPENDKLYVDLHGNKAAEIDADGWRVVTNPPVYFRRPPGVLPQVEPTQDGSLETLRDMLGLADDRTWHLLVGFLIAAYHPTGPYPVLVLSGEQGTGKSTTAVLLGRLIDPNKAQLEKAPTREDDIPVQAAARHLLAWDNLSSVPNWFSDALCGLATELTHTRRKLYSDADLYVFNATRPTLINGIEDLATRPDLLSRALLVHLETMPEGKRKEREAVYAAFDAARPALLGAVFDAVSCAMRNKDRIRIKNAPRMADMAGWVTRAEPALGWPLGTYMWSFQYTAEEASSIALEASPLAQGLLQWLAHRDKGFSGYAATLLSELNSSSWIHPEVRHEKGWPKLANRLTNNLKRIAPALRRQGWDIHIERDKKGAQVTVKPCAGDGTSVEGDGMPEVIVLEETETTPGAVASYDGSDGDDGILRGTSVPELEKESREIPEEASVGVVDDRHHRHDRQSEVPERETMGASAPIPTTTIPSSGETMTVTAARVSSRCPTCGQTLGSNPLTCQECEAELVWRTENARCRHRGEYTSGTDDGIVLLDWKTGEWRAITTTQTCADCGMTFYCEAPEVHQADWVPFGCPWCNSAVAKQVGEAEERLEELEKRAHEQRVQQVREQTICLMCGEPSWPHDLCPVHRRFELWLGQQPTPMVGGDLECAHEVIHEDGDSIVMCDECGGQWHCDHGRLYEKFEGGTYGCRDCGYYWSQDNTSPERFAEIAAAITEGRPPQPPGQAS